jgi:hypothetical protein
MYYVVRMLSDGSLKCINATHDKEYANDLCDSYSEDYPHAYVDILTSEDVDELQLQEKSWSVKAGGQVQTLSQLLPPTKGGHTYHHGYPQSNCHSTL